MALPSAAEFLTARDGVRLFYRRIGSGGPAVIAPFEAALGTDFDRLAAAGRTLVLYDMRNRGQSDAVAENGRIGIRQDLDDLEDLCAGLALARVSLIGYSYLGKLVVLYALEHPERVERIVQLGPIPPRYPVTYPAGLGPAERPAKDPAALADLKAMREQNEHLKNPQAYCEHEFRLSALDLVGDARNTARVRNPCRMINEWPTNLMRHFEHHIRTLAQFEYEPARYRAVTAPVLAIHGTLDRNAPYGAGREWAMTLPNARLITVEGAAHQSWADAPDLILGAIDTFLKGQWPGNAEQVKTLAR